MKWQKKSLWLLKIDAIKKMWSNVCVCVDICVCKCFWMIQFVTANFGSLTFESRCICIIKRWVSEWVMEWMVSWLTLICNNWWMGYMWSLVLLRFLCLQWFHCVWYRLVFFQSPYSWKEISRFLYILHTPKY